MYMLQLNNMIKLYQFHLCLHIKTIQNILRKTQAKMVRKLKSKSDVLKSSNESVYNGSNDVKGMIASEMNGERTNTDTVATRINGKCSYMNTLVSGIDGNRLCTGTVASRLDGECSNNCTCQSEFIDNGSKCNKDISTSLNNLDNTATEINNATASNEINNATTSTDLNHAYSLDNCSTSTSNSSLSVESVVNKDKSSVDQDLCSRKQLVDLDSCKLRNPDVGNSAEQAGNMFSHNKMVNDDNLLEKCRTNSSDDMSSDSCKNRTEKVSERKDLPVFHMSAHKCAEMINDNVAESFGELDTEQNEIKTTNEVEKVRRVVLDTR